MPRRSFLLPLLGPMLWACLTSRAVAGDGPAESASEWRIHQRAEIVTLPRPPAPPGTRGHPLDRFLAVAWAQQRWAPPAVVDDRTFARRAYLDVIGLVPPAEQLEQFVRDAGSDKRSRLVDALLADRQGYAEHWMTFWNDLLRNDEQTSIDGLREPVTGWLYRSLLVNKPLDRFVAELLDPARDGPAGYLKGVNWRGRVNASQAPSVQAAQNVSQVFLASSIKCASCHNSFINAWKLEEAYGMASFFVPENPQVYRCDKPTGKIVPPRFLFPEMGEVSPKAGLAERRRALARLVTRPANPRFARTLVNRLWKQLLGRGLVEPADDFDGKGSAPPLLDWLAYDFMTHDDDAKQTLRLILTSRVYQSPTVVTPEPFRGTWQPPMGPRERRLTSEQFLDAVAQVTQYWTRPQVMGVAVDGPAVRAWRNRQPDALAIALGRPNREQVCTQRDEESTVLQALELVNGPTLSRRLEQGVLVLLASDLARQDAATVAREFYVRALGRQPTPAEVTLARSFLGKPDDPAQARRAGWEDFLWGLFMSPEFQFVR